MKRQTAEAPPAAPVAAEVHAEQDALPPQLPPIESLTKDSDYSVFFQPKVDEDIRRAALKKLFSDPQFSVMDGLDIYLDDYSISEPIPAAMLAQMESAQKIFKWARGESDEEDSAKPEEQPPQDAIAAVVEGPQEQDGAPKPDALEDCGLAGDAPAAEPQTMAQPLSRTKS